MGVERLVRPVATFESYAEAHPEEHMEIGNMEDEKDEEEIEQDLKGDELNAKDGDKDAEKSDNEKKDGLGQDVVTVDDAAIQEADHGGKEEEGRRGVGMPSPLVVSRKERARAHAPTV